MEDFRALRKQGTFWDKQDPRVTRHTREEKNSNLATIAETANQIKQKETSTACAEIASERKSREETLTTSEPPPKTPETSKNREESQEQALPPNFLEKSKNEEDPQ